MQVNTHIVHYKAIMKNLQYIFPMVLKNIVELDSLFTTTQNFYSDNADKIKFNLSDN